MSDFLDNYLKKHRLDKMLDAMKQNVEKLENKLKEHVNSAVGPKTFEDVLQQYGEQIADLVERLSNYLTNMPEWSLSSVYSLFRFVINISVEAYQIVEDMSDCVITDDMTDKEKHQAKVEFGQELVYFIWMTVDPLKDHFNWLPFKDSIVKKIVYWRAGMALESTVDLFAAQAVSAMSAQKTKVFLRAIP